MFTIKNCNAFEMSEITIPETVSYPRRPGSSAAQVLVYVCIFLRNVKLILFCT